MRAAVVLLTGSAPQHREVAAHLARTGLLTHVLEIEAPSATLSGRINRGRRRFGSTGLVTRAMTGVVLRATGEHQRRTRAVERVLQADWPATPRERLVGVNSQETLNRLQELRPHVLCVYGTAVVRDHVLATASRVALNLHTGISPRYRGADCAFWPLHEREPEWLGATVHECTSALDGGAIYGIAQAELEEGDGVGECFARCVLAGAQLYGRVLEEVFHATARPQPQNLREGREYKAAMRDWRAEARVHRLLSQGLVRRHVRSGSTTGTRPDGLLGPQA